LEACPDSGYGDSDLADMVYRKTMRLKERSSDDPPIPTSDALIHSLLAVLITAQSHRQDNKINVVDLGGACGAHYLVIRPLLNPDVKLNWAVVETSTMAQRAKPLETEELKFYPSLSSAQENCDRIDLLHSSGTIQYVSDPRRTIEEILDFMPTFIFLNRLALSEKKTIVAIQNSLLSANGPGPAPDDVPDRISHYPVTYFPKTQLEKMLRPKYQIKLRFSETTSSFGGELLFINGGLLAERCK
jgi:putative methyltransferase (TIGR04325 family)